LAKIFAWLELDGIDMAGSLQNIEAERVTGKIL
jgi:hypothetical protein